MQNRGSKGGGEPIIRAENVVKEYVLGRTTLRVLRGVSMEVRRGQFVAIVGASGSGKSTLLHILGALDIPQEGQVWFEDQPLFDGERRAAAVRPAAGAAQSGESAQLSYATKSDLRAAKIAARPPLQTLDQIRNQIRNTRVGFVFQFYHLLPEFNVVENVMMPALVGHSVTSWSAQRSDLRARALGLLETVEMGHRHGHRPNELSGGERQRVAIARALMNQPAVLLADEPTGNLDTRTGGEIMARLRGLNAAGQTIVMVTHDPEIARQADHSVRLVDGRAA